MSQYDAIIVGARCAGSPTAMLLARKGYRVLLLDKAVFPSDTMSSHILHPPGVAALKRWSLLQRLQDTGCPPIRHYAFDFGPFAIASSLLPSDGTSFALCPRRTVLDKLLVDAAVEAGAELRGFSARDHPLERLGSSCRRALSAEGSCYRSRRSRKLSLNRHATSVAAGS